MDESPVSTSKLDHLNISDDKSPGQKLVEYLETCRPCFSDQVEVISHDDLHPDEPSECIIMGDRHFWVRRKGNYDGPLLVSPKPPANPVVREELEKYRMICSGPNNPNEQLEKEYQEMLKDDVRRAEIEKINEECILECLEWGRLETGEECPYDLSKPVNIH